MFTFGIGSSVNRHLIEGMARVGMGEPFVITKPEEARQKAEKFRKLIESPVLTGITVDFGDFEVYDVEPPSIPDVLADRPVIVFGKWRGRPEGTIHLRGTTAHRPFMKEIAVAEAKPLRTNSALRYLWARHRIAVLADYNRLRPQDERIQEVTDLGLSYNLLTAYTSFVAVDSQIRLRDGQAVTVKQPLPLPEGVSDYAVGSGVLAQKACASPALAPTAMGRNTVAEERYREYEGHLVTDASLTRPNSEEVHIELKTVAVTEGLSKDSIEGLIEKLMPSINSCYKKPSGNGSGAKGEIVLRLVIESSGRVTGVHIDKGHPKNRALEQCIVEKLKKLPFPAPNGGGSGVATVVFTVK